VADGSGFNVGDVIQISDAANAELNRITGISSPPLVGAAPIQGPAVLALECALQFTHAAGESVTETDAPFSGCVATPTPEPTDTPEPDPTDTPVPTSTNTPPATSTNTPVVTRTAQATRTVQATRTAVVTRTVVVTATPDDDECFTLGEKLFLILGILKRFGAREGHWRYKELYDLNDDGKINWKDLEIVLETPLCRRHR
jgi:hypothetical protein